MNQSIRHFAAFSISFPGLKNRITSDASVSEPIITNDSIALNDPRLIPAKAMWDTGATMSGISRPLAERMKLKRTREAYTTHAKGQEITNVYTIDLYLPNNIAIPQIEVLEVESFKGDFDIIIGMNIIALGDFSITNVAGKTTFSFRIPSVKTIDYVNEARGIKNKILSSTGRNDPCPCGSGKKFKQCCAPKCGKF